MKKILSKFVNALSIIIIILAVFILLNVVMTKDGSVPEIGGYSMLRVLTGSMEPAIPTNSILIVHRVDPEEIQVGDIISFYSADPTLGGSVNTHRVTEIREDNGALIFETQGDANPVKDKYPVPENALIGTVVFSSLIIGTAIRLLSNPLVFVPLILVPLVVLMTVNTVRAVRSAKDIMRQEEEEAIREAIEKAKSEKRESASQNEEKGS